MIVRERGRGTFVAPPKLTESAVQRLSGFYEDMLTLGHPAVSQVLRQESVRASKHIAALLKVPVGGRVVEIERLRFVHDDPVVLTTTYLPEVLCPGLRDADLSRRSLYEYLESECGLTLRPRPADDRGGGSRRAPGEAAANGDQSTIDPDS